MGYVSAFSSNVVCPLASKPDTHPSGSGPAPEAQRLRTGPEGRAHLTHGVADIAQHLKAKSTCHRVSDAARDSSLKLTLTAAQFWCERPRGSSSPPSAPALGSGKHFYPLPSGLTDLAQMVRVSPFPGSQILTRLPPSPCPAVPVTRPPRVPPVSPASLPSPSGQAAASVSTSFLPLNKIPFETCDAVASTVTESHGNG